MNVNITGIYDNTVIVDSNLFDDVKLLQTGLSSLSDTLFSVVEGLPYQYANLTAFTTLSNDYEAYKITNNTNISNLNNITTSLSNKTDFSNLLVSNASTLLSSLNVSGQSTLNNVNIKGNLNVDGTTTIMNTIINNTSMHSLRVSGPSIYYSNVTLISNLNVSGNSNLNNVNIYGATYFYGHLFAQQNIYGQLFQP